MTTGDTNDRDGRKNVVAKLLPPKRKTIHDRHRQIQKDKPGWMTAGGDQSVTSVNGGLYGKPGCGEREFEQRPTVCVIVNY